MLPALLSRRVRRWAVLAVAAPAAGWAVEQLRERAEASRGPSSRVTRTLHHTGRALETVNRRR